MCDLVYRRPLTSKKTTGPVQGRSAVFGVRGTSSIRYPWSFASRCLENKKKKPNPSFNPPSDSDSSLDTVATTPERVAFNFNSRLKGSLSPTDRFWQPTKINDARLCVTAQQHVAQHSIFPLNFVTPVSTVLVWDRNRRWTTF
ncbi:hypothetical protein NPIL_695141 [Nephila pilipes]|uniref:Uncharacterized protein n=1 Tax=Nephila pilipes TaxID=299642 RepID=A0A8X6NIV8_NEPPI|nr:hypothetical protein NPIL_695141 [Nephila pilipes]